ncbi:hypothetical protein BCR43DRAFT_488589 [Syncephalastrum racemosum]|uniref:Uncharacterized protein n=1 Tax=Syncephalastrum racemosum TaxID=13706 RepID=A0A1X2HJ27_SYNRA|nr:hypothetical protein BCR43DRAFT_488589 [Syncephalastrum racemosum]
MAARASYIFLIHAIAEILAGVVFMLAPELLETGLDNLYLVRVLGAAMISLAVPGLTCFHLPEMLPCKRAFATGCITYHGLVPIITFLAQKDGLVDSKTGGATMGVHALLFFGFAVWFKATEGQAKQFNKAVASKAQ